MSEIGKRSNSGAECIISKTQMSSFFIPITHMSLKLSSERHQALCMSCLHVELIHISVTEAVVSFLPLFEECVSKRLKTHQTRDQFAEGLNTPELSVHDAHLSCVDSSFYLFFEKRGLLLRSALLITKRKSSM